MNGILLVDKPADWTSHDVVAKLRGVLGERRMGHSGTLDPMATGLLVVFAGRATRAVSFSENHSKCYEARLRLGLTTDTQDTTGTVLSRCDRRVTRAELEAIAEVCCRRNVYVIADEIYCNLVYDNNEFVSFASLSEDMIFTLFSSHVMFLLFSNIPCITLAAAGAQLPFSMSPMVRFW